MSATHYPGDLCEQDPTAVPPLPAPIAVEATWQVPSGRGDKIIVKRNDAGIAIFSGSAHVSIGAGQFREFLAIVAAAVQWETP